jgi:hypothetical protein
MEDNSSQHMHDSHGDKAMGCNCMYCRMGGGHRHMVLRLILGLIILGMVFCLGMKIGEFKGEFSNEGRHSFYGHDSQMMHRNMMYGGEKFNVAVPSEQVPGVNTPQPTK